MIKRAGLGFKTLSLIPHFNTGSSYDFRQITKSLYTSISCHNMGLNYYIIYVGMPWSFAQPLATQCNGISKTVANCNDDLDSFPGSCLTYIARTLGPATKSVYIILFNQKEITFTKLRCSNPLRHIGAGRARYAIHMQTFAYNHGIYSCLQLLQPMASMTNMGLPPRKICGGVDN